jgi:hypothetical protein
MSDNNTEKKATGASVKFDKKNSSIQNIDRLVEELRIFTDINKQ